MYIVYKHLFNIVRGLAVIGGMLLSPAFMMWASQGVCLGRLMDPLEVAISDVKTCRVEYFYFTFIMCLENRLKPYKNLI